MKIYAIPGLGADKRVFEHLQLEYELVALDWIPPKNLLYLMPKATFNLSINIAWFLFETK